jgi:hypothetical protein
MVLRGKLASDFSGCLARIILRPSQSVKYLFDVLAAKMQTRQPVVAKLTMTREKIILSTYRENHYII